MTTDIPTPAELLTLARWGIQFTLLDEKTFHCLVAGCCDYWPHSGQWRSRVDGTEGDDFWGLFFYIRDRRRLAEVAYHNEITYSRGQIRFLQEAFNELMRSYVLVQRQVVELVDASKCIDRDFSDAL